MIFYLEQNWKKLPINSLTSLNCGTLWIDLNRVNACKTRPEHTIIFFLLGWKYSSGFINEEIIRDHLFAASDDTITLMCGPPPMINFACQPNLEKLGHSKDLILAY